MVNSNRVESCRRLLKLPANWALHFQQQVDSPLLIDKKGNDIQVTYRYDAEAFRALLLLKENAAKQDFHLSETPRFAHDGVMVKDIFKATGDLKWLSSSYEALKKEYAFWMKERIAPWAILAMGRAIASPPLALPFTPNVISMSIPRLPMKRPQLRVITRMPSCR